MQVIYFLAYLLNSVVAFRFFFCDFQFFIRKSFGEKW